jgi:hypothetical protein
LTIQIRVIVTSFLMNVHSFIKKKSSTVCEAFYIEKMSYLFAGAPAGALTGAPPGVAPGSGPTFPFILTTFTGSFTAFELIVTVLLIGPGRFVSYFTSISEDSPGKIGFGSHFGTVQPQDPWQLVKTNMSVPVFVTLNLHSPFPPNGTSP